MKSLDTQVHPRKGHLTEPEVFENVPGHVLPIIEREFDDFDNEAEKFLEGQTEEVDFVGFRLKQGVYGQRQANVQMVRVKVPMGVITADQMDTFADAIEEFAPLNKGHITTRQAIQVHHMPLPTAADFIRKIGMETNLSSREACGNTVRNVTCDPFAGVTPGEPFDPTPYGAAFARYFVRSDLTQLLPRKFKVAFSSNDEDRAITLIHDLGFIPRIKEGIKGFEIRCGGGTSIMPRIGYTLYDFVPLDEYLKVSEAVIRIFDRADELRKNRARARLKFLVDRIGIEEFRERVDEELRGDWINDRDFDPEPLALKIDEEATAPAKPETFSSPSGDTSDFSVWQKSNVFDQRQEGFSAVTVRVNRGDLTPEQFRGLAAVMRNYSNSTARTTVQQNMVIRWVRDESLHDVWQDLKPLGLGEAGANKVADVVSCPGTDSCKMGITSSMGLNTAVRERIDSMKIDVDDLASQIYINISGCPNGCGQHHLGSIGLHGASMKFDGKQVPAYLPLIGGARIGTARIGQRLKARIPAKRVPDAIERWIRLYQADRTEGETFNEFADRVGHEPFEAQVKDLGLAVEFNEDSKTTFIDWERNQLYEVIRGEGECAI